MPLLEKVFEGAHKGPSSNTESKVGEHKHKYIYSTKFCFTLSDRDKYCTLYVCLNVHAYDLTLMQYFSFRTDCCSKGIWYKLHLDG